MKKVNRGALMLELFLASVIVVIIITAMAKFVQVTAVSTHEVTERMRGQEIIREIHHFLRKSDFDTLISTSPYTNFPFINMRGRFSARADVDEINSYLTRSATITVQTNTVSPRVFTAVVTLAPEEETGAPIIYPMGSPYTPPSTPVASPTASPTPTSAVPTPTPVASPTVVPTPPVVVPVPTPAPPSVYPTPASPTPNPRRRRGFR